MQVDLSSQLRQIIADMVFQIAALKAENEALREQLAKAANGQNDSPSAG